MIYKLTKVYTNDMAINMLNNSFPLYTKMQNHYLKYPSVLC